MDISSIHEIFLKSSGVSTDTRKIFSGCLFVAIKGANFDANTFAAEALAKGAAHTIIDNPEFYIDERTILVNDSLATLQELSTFHREWLGIPIVSLTGSNGKTTTKELINAVLKKKYKCAATFGNLNNHIGVPLTLLSFTRETEIGIVEMGANHQKEIEFLCRLAKPDFGYITNFGKAHLEGFGGVEGVIRGKSEMYDYLRNNGKTAFVNLDDPIQERRSEGIKRFSFSIGSPADVEIDAISADPFVKITYNTVNIQSNLIGAYNAPNIIAAIAIGTFFNVAQSDIKSAIESYTPDNNRSQLITRGSNEIILDAYNANPSSMMAAIDNFRKLQKPEKVAILGDMFELGAESLQEHKNILEQAAKASGVGFHFVGKDFFAVKAAFPEAKFFENYELLREHLQNCKIENSLMLIKGSRGMALERILEEI